MTSWHSYPKIYNVGHAAIDELLRDSVIVEEKVDGSQFSFGMIGGELLVRSRGKQFPTDAPDKMFTKAVASVLDRQSILKEGWTYRGEYLQKPKHNALAYDRIPNDNIILFDINTNEETYLSYEEKAAEAERIGLEIVPLLHSGMVDNITVLTDLLDTVSILGGQKIEGFVIKNYKRFTTDGKAMMGKHVSEAFKEVHSKEWGKSNPGKQDIILGLIDKYRTPARWQKAVQHIQERGELDGSPKDIGNLIKETQKDIHDECYEEIAVALMKHFFPQILRGVTRGLPEWYKDELLKAQFDE
jgi:hypothetical protein